MYKSDDKKNMNNKKTSNNKSQSTMDDFKLEAANEVGIDLDKIDNGNLTTREAGSIGGQMVKKMVESYKKNLKEE